MEIEPENRGRGGDAAKASEEKSVPAEPETTRRAAQGDAAPEQKEKAKQQREEAAKVVEPPAPKTMEDMGKREAAGPAKEREPPPAPQRTEKKAKKAKQESPAPRKEVPAFGRPLGMKCKVYWPEEDAWFHGMIKDVRRNLKAKYNVGTAENEKFEERVIKKAFFVRYDDGDRDWLQIFKFSQGEGEEKQVVCINKSQQLDYYWDDDLKEYRESARDYEPKPIQERRDEIVREEEEREEKRKRKDKEEEERRRKLAEAKSNDHLHDVKRTAESLRETTGKVAEKVSKRAHEERARFDGADDDAKRRRVDTEVNPEVLKAKEVLLKEKGAKKNHPKPPAWRRNTMSPMKIDEPITATASGAGAGAAEALPTTRAGTQSEGDASDGAAVERFKRLYANPEFVKSYEALANQFDAPSSSAAVARGGGDLPKHVWTDWRTMRDLCEKDEGWLEEKERSLLKRLQHHLS